MFASPWISATGQRWKLYVLYILAISVAQLTFQGVGPADWLSEEPWIASRISMIGGVRYDELGARVTVADGRADVHGRLAQTAERALLLDGATPVQLALSPWRFEAPGGPGDSLMATWVVRDSNDFEVARVARALAPSACAPTETQVADFAVDLSPGRYQIGLTIVGSEHYDCTGRS